MFLRLGLRISDHDFPGFSHVELLASHFLDGLRIRLQGINVLLQSLIFLFQLEGLFLKSIVPLALASIGQVPVLATNDVIGERTHE